MLTLAAILSSANPLPQMIGPTKPVNVIYLTTEDDMANTVVPRFIRTGGNRSRLTFIKDFLGHSSLDSTAVYAITDVVNNSGGNVVMAAQMFGNSPETIRKHYYTQDSLENQRNVLNKRRAKELVR